MNRTGKIDMSLLDFSMKELNLIGMTEGDTDEMNSAMRKHILHIIQEFADGGHSGFSASYAISILSKLMQYKPLSPLTGEDSEWNDVADYGDGTTLYQNNRRSSVFKDADGSCYDIDGKVFWEWYKDDASGWSKSYYSGQDSRTPVTFPYTVPDKPIYEYRHSDAEPRTPPQNENGPI